MSKFLPSKLDDYLSFYESLTLDSLDQVANFVTPDVLFRDPFNEVTGVEAYREILVDMFERCKEPKFKILSVVRDDQTAFIKWSFSFIASSKEPKEWEIVGVSELKFSDDGLISQHIDYWDPASQLYERFPIIGSIFAFCRKRLSAH